MGKNNETPDEQETHGKVEKRSITIEMNKMEGKTSEDAVEDVNKGENEVDDAWLGVILRKDFANNAVVREIYAKCNKHETETIKRLKDLNKFVLVSGDIWKSYKKWFCNIFYKATMVIPYYFYLALKQNAVFFLNCLQFIVAMPMFVCILFPSPGELVFFGAFGTDLTVALCWQDLTAYWKTDKTGEEKEKKGRLPIVTVLHYFLETFFLQWIWMPVELCLFLILMFTSFLHVEYHRCLFQLRNKALGRYDKMYFTVPLSFFRGAFIFSYRISRTVLLFIFTCFLCVYFLLESVLFLVSWFFVFLVYCCTLGLIEIEHQIYQNELMAGINFLYSGKKEAGGKKVVKWKERKVGPKSNGKDADVIKRQGSSFQLRRQYTVVLRTWFERVTDPRLYYVVPVFFIRSLACLIFTLVLLPFVVISATVNYTVTFVVYCGPERKNLDERRKQLWEKEEITHNIMNIIEIHLFSSYEFVPKTLLFLISLPLQIVLFAIICISPPCLALKCIRRLCDRNTSYAEKAYKTIPSTFLDVCKWWLALFLKYDLPVLFVLVCLILLVLFAVVFVLELSMYLLVCITVVQAVECTDELEELLDETGGKKAINVRRMSAHYLSQDMHASVVEINPVPAVVTNSFVGVKEDKEAAEEKDAYSNNASLARLIQLELLPYEQTVLVYDKCDKDEEKARQRLMKLVQYDMLIMKLRKLSPGLYDREKILCVLEQCGYNERKARDEIVMNTLTIWLVRARNFLSIVPKHLSKAILFYIRQTICLPFYIISLAMVLLTSILLVFTVPLWTKLMDKKRPLSDRIMPFYRPTFENFYLSILFYLFLPMQAVMSLIILGCGFEAKRWWIELFFNPEKVAWKLRIFYTTWKYFILTMRKTGAEAGDFADAAGEFVATKIKKMVAGAGGIVVALLKLFIALCAIAIAVPIGAVELCFFIIICIFRVEYYDCIYEIKHGDTLWDAHWVFRALWAIPPHFFITLVFLAYFPFLVLMFVVILGTGVQLKQCLKDLGYWYDEDKLALTDLELTEIFEMEVVDKFLRCPSMESNDEKRDDVCELLSLYKYHIIQERDRNNKNATNYSLSDKEFDRIRARLKPVLLNACIKKINAIEGSLKKVLQNRKEERRYARYWTAIPKNFIEMCAIILKLLLNFTIVTTKYSFKALLFSLKLLILDIIIMIPLTVSYTAIMLSMFLVVFFSVQNTVCIKQIKEAWKRNKSAAIAEKNTATVAEAVEAGKGKVEKSTEIKQTDTTKDSTGGIYIEIFRIMVKHFLTALMFWVYFPFWLLGIIFTTVCPPCSYSRQMWSDLLCNKKLSREERIWGVVGKYALKTLGYCAEKVGHCLTTCFKCGATSLRMLSYFVALLVIFPLLTLWSVTVTVTVVAGIVFLIPCLQVLFRGPPKHAAAALEKRDKEFVNWKKVGWICSVTMRCFFYSIFLWLLGGPCLFYLLLLYCFIGARSKAEKDELSYITSIVFAKHASYCKRKFEDRADKQSIESYSMEFKNCKEDTVITAYETALKRGNEKLITTFLKDGGIAFQFEILDGVWLLYPLSLRLLFRHLKSALLALFGLWRVCIKALIAMFFASLWLGLGVPCILVVVPTPFRSDMFLEFKTNGGHVKNPKNLLLTWKYFCYALPWIILFPVQYIIAFPIVSCFQNKEEKDLRVEEYKKVGSPKKYWLYAMYAANPIFIRIARTKVGPCVGKVFFLCSKLLGAVVLLPFVIALLLLEGLMLVTCAISGILVLDFHIIKAIRQFYQEEKDYFLLGLVIPQYFLLAVIFIMWAPCFWLLRGLVILFGGKERRRQLKEDLLNPEGDHFYLVWPVLFHFFFTFTSLLRIPCALALLPCAWITRGAAHIVFFPWRQRGAKYFHVWPKKLVVFFGTQNRFEWLYDVENGLGYNMRWHITWQEISKLCWNVLLFPIAVNLAFVVLLYDLGTVIFCLQAHIFYALGGFFVAQSGRIWPIKLAILATHLTLLIIFYVYVVQVPLALTDTRGLFWTRGMFNACSKEALADGSCEDYINHAEYDVSASYRLAHDIAALFFACPATVALILNFVHFYQLYFKERPFIIAQWRKITQLIGKPDVKKLTEGKLRTINLKKRKINDADCFTIAQILSKAKRINELIISENHIGPHGCLLLESASVNLDNCETFNFDDNHFGDMGAVFLSRMLFKSVALVELNLSHNSISSNGFLEVLQGLSPDMTTFESLIMQGNDIDDTGMEYFADAMFEGNKTCLEFLRTIDFSGNKITGKSFDSISNALGKMRHLEHIYLNDNNISDDSFEKLELVLLGCGSLISLDMSHNNISYKRAKHFYKKWEDAGKDRASLHME